MQTSEGTSLAPADRRWSHMTPACMCNHPQLGDGLICVGHCAVLHHFRKGAQYIVQEASRGINEAQRGEQFATKGPAQPVQLAAAA